MSLNRLTRPQMRQLEDQILKDWDTIVKSNSSMNLFASQATGKLGFMVTNSNVAKACTSISRTWPSTLAQAADHRRGPLARGGQMATFQQYEDLRTSVVQLTSAVRDLTAAVQCLTEEYMGIRAAKSPSQSGG